MQLRLLVDRTPEQRYDQHGVEVLELHGHVVDSKHAHPLTVVRFSGQRRVELYRWAKPGKHLAIDGYLQVKHFRTRGVPRVALLIEGININPLDDVEVDLSRAGIYAVRGRVGKVAPRAAPMSKAERAEKARTLLDLADA